jgi:hypothetical protein
MRTGRKRSWIVAFWRLFGLCVQSSAQRTHALLFQDSLYLIEAEQIREIARLSEPIYPPKIFEKK